MCRKLNTKSMFVLGSSQEGKLPEIEEEEEASIVAMDDTESFHSD